MRRTDPDARRHTAVPPDCYGADIPVFSLAVRIGPDGIHPDGVEPFGTVTDDPAFACANPYRAAAIDRDPVINDCSFQEINGPDARRELNPAPAFVLAQRFPRYDDSGLRGHPETPELILDLLPDIQHREAVCHHVDVVLIAVVAHKSRGIDHHP